MAIFNKTKEEKKVVKATKSKKEGSGLLERVNVIVRPHITEKAAVLAEKGTYVFEIAKDTNKIEIAKAIASLYKVTPIRVNIVNLPKTNVFLRGRKGVKAGVRKAMVTLKKGEKIEIL